MGGGKEGRFFLLDSNRWGEPDHETPLFRSELISNANMNFQTQGTWGSLAAWKDESGTQWVLAPNGGPTLVKFRHSYGPTPNGGILAFQVQESGGRTILAPAWQSRDMVTAEPPVVANGVVFALAGGEFTGQTNDVEGGLFSRGAKNPTVSSRRSSMRWMRSRAKSCIPAGTRFPRSCTSQVLRLPVGG